MPNTNSWLCIYAIAQLGRPYWFYTCGQISSPDVYAKRVTPSGYTYNNYMEQLGVKVHDCSGLVLGALICNDVNEAVPENCNGPVAHRATLQYYNSCSPRGSSMSTFPKLPGTLVFTTKNSSTKSHVGIYVGTFTDLDGVTHTDMVVEAKGHDYGVVATPVSNKKWDCWGQIKFCARDTDSNTHFDARGILGVQPETNTVQVGTPITIETKNMMPFVATVFAGQNPKLDYKKINAARISAMMFYGGQLYDQNHIEQTYTNPYLKDLTHQCNNAGVPYALYVNVRARTLIEADKECRALYYMVSRYSPKLGLWLSIQTGASKNTNDKILEIYYKYIEKWGLKARCGLYVTQKQLNTITWTTFQDRFYLWMIDPKDVSEVDDELLQPEMFEVPD